MNIHTKFVSFFLFLISASQCVSSHAGSLINNEEEKKSWLVTCLPRMPALVMTSLIQTAGHKMAAFSVVSSRLPAKCRSLTVILETKTKIRAKN